MMEGGKDRGEGEGEGSCRGRRASTLPFFAPPDTLACLLSRSVSLSVCSVATQRCSLSPHSSSRLLGHLSPAPVTPPRPAPPPLAVSLPSLITLSSSITTFSPIRQPSLLLSLSQRSYFSPAQNEETMRKKE